MDVEKILTQHQSAIASLASSDTALIKAVNKVKSVVPESAAPNNPLVDEKQLMGVIEGRTQFLSSYAQLPTGEAAEVGVFYYVPTNTLPTEYRQKNDDGEVVPVLDTEYTLLVWRPASTDFPNGAWVMSQSPVDLSEYAKTEYVDGEIDRCFKEGGLYEENYGQSYGILNKNTGLPDLLFDASGYTPSEGSPGVVRVPSTVGFEYKLNDYGYVGINSLVGEGDNSRLVAFSVGNTGDGSSVEISEWGSIACRASGNYLSLGYDISFTGSGHDGLEGWMTLCPTFLDFSNCVNLSKTGLRVSSVDGGGGLYSYPYAEVNNYSISVVMSGDWSQWNRYATITGDNVLVSSQLAFISIGTIDYNTGSTNPNIAMSDENGNTVTLGYSDIVKLKALIN